jgi:hypothetical protein
VEHVHETRRKSEVRTPEPAAPAAAVPAGLIPVPQLGRLPLGAQASLEVGRADDPYEVEADDRARTIVAALRRAPAAAPDEQARPEQTAGLVTRLCRMAEPIGAAGGALDAHVEHDLQAARANGRPLEPTLRRRFEDVMGADLSGVRVHEGSQARRLNEQVQAKAFTLEQDIFFRDRIPSPGSNDHLLAHELTHTVQQSNVSALRRVIRRTPDDDTVEEPDAAVKYTLAQARKKLTLVHPDKKMPDGVSHGRRKQIAAAWGRYILDELQVSRTAVAKKKVSASQLKNHPMPGAVRDTYKSKYDKGAEEEFSASLNVDNVPEIVLHVHLDEKGNPKPGKAAHWKWSDKELMLGESYELSEKSVDRFVTVKGANKHWDNKQAAAAAAAAAAAPKAGGV